MKLELAVLKKRFQVRTVLAVTLESGRIAVNLVRREENTSRVMSAFTLPIGAEAVLADPERAGQRLAAELESAGIRERRCVVCIPAGWAMTTSTDVPGVAADDLRAFLELRAEREFPVPVADLRLAHCAYALPDGKACATIAAVPAKRMEAIERMLATAECRAVSVSLGLDGCLPRGGMPTALHFLANGNHVDVVIAAGGGIAAVRSLPAPANAETAAFDALGFSREIRITLGRLPEALRQEVREARFSGATASAETLCTEMRPHLQRMGIDSRLEGAAGGEPAALEAAGEHLGQRPVAFEFLTPEVNRWQLMARQFDDRRRRWLAIAAVAALVLPILIFIVRSRMESGLTAEWKGMSGKVTAVEKLQTRIRLFRPWFDPAPQTLQILEALDSAFPEQGDVWAKSVQVSDGAKINCVLFARNQAAMLAFLTRLRAHKDVSSVQVQTQRGENPIQFSMTYRWGHADAK